MPADASPNHEAGDRTRAVSRHTLAYVLCSISELLRHYKFDPVDLLIIHAVPDSNVLDIMKDPDLDRRFGSLHTVEPDTIKRGVSRGSLSRFLNLPPETVRRRIERLKKTNILVERDDGLIVSEDNQHRFGNNHHLQQVNVVLVRKLLKDLARAGIRGPGRHMISLRWSAPGSAALPGQSHRIEHSNGLFFFVSEEDASKGSAVAPASFCMAAWEPCGSQCPMSDKYALNPNLGQRKGGRTLP